MFASSDRTWSARGSEPLTSADALPLLGTHDLSPTSAVILREQRARVLVQNRGPNWRANAVHTDEQNHGRVSRDSEVLSLPVKSARSRVLPRETARRG